MSGFFGGDLKGIEEKLEYLLELGVNTVYLCPIFASTANHRYHTHDYFKIDPVLGNLEDFKALLNAVHSKGMKLILDGVFNHCSRGFYQFNSLLEEGELSPYVEWFRVKRFPIKAYSNKEPDYECWWNIPALPQFNHDNPDVREFLFSVAEYWIELGIDGWRLDVPDEIRDHEFWKEFRKRVHRINPEAYIVGEIWKDPSPWLGGDEFDAVMNYRVYKDITYLLFPDLQESIGLDDYVQRLGGLLQVAEPHSQMNLMGSHDTKRVLTLAGNDVYKTKMAYSIMFFMPGAPCIYYGDEISIKGGKDPDCRRTFPWDESQWNHEFRDFIKLLILLRKQNTCLISGEITVQNRNGMLSVSRFNGGGHLNLLVNVSDQEGEVPSEEINEIILGVKFNGPKNSLKPKGILIYK